MAPSKKKPDTPPGQGGTPPGQSGKPPKPQQYDVRAAAVAVGVAEVDIQLTIGPPVEPPPEGTRHTVGVAATARGRVLAHTAVIPAGSGPATDPTLPATVPDTGDPVMNAAQLQAALNAATPGDVIVLEAGAQYSGELDVPEEP